MWNSLQSHYTIIKLFVTINVLCLTPRQASANCSLRNSSLTLLFVFIYIVINKALEMQRQAKINDKNRRFGVFMTPLSRRSKITEFAARCNNKLAYSV